MDESAPLQKSRYSPESPQTHEQQTETNSDKSQDCSSVWWKIYNVY